jgi:hypothetical protein
MQGRFVTIDRVMDPPFNRPLRARARIIPGKRNTRPRMLDEATAYSRLDSAVYVSLIHALEVTGACLRADVAAGRIYDTPDHAVNVHVSAHGLGLSAAQHADFNTWPNDKGSIFDYAAQGVFGDRVFRIDEMPNVSRVSRQRFFAKLANYTTIQDALCVSFSVAQSTWGTFVFIRCGSSLPFDNTHMDTLN